VIGGNPYIDSSSSVPETTTVDLFGETYSAAYNQINVVYSSDGSFTTTNNKDYTSLSGGYMNDGNWSSSSGSSGSSRNGWDPYVGTFGLDNSSPPQWTARTGPSFAQSQLWVRQSLISWTGGTLTSEGVVTDSYSGTVDGIPVALTISGSVRSFITNGAPASVTMNGQDVGTLAAPGTFSDPLILNGAANKVTPVFSFSSLWVNGTEFGFVGGWEDSSGTRADMYSNASSGWLRVSGNVSSLTTANVIVCLDQPYTGSFQDGFFFVAQVDIQTESTLAMPAAFWVTCRQCLQFSRRLPDGLLAEPVGSRCHLSGLRPPGQLLWHLHDG
jgi:hypothetical protein